MQTWVGIGICTARSTGALRLVKCCNALFAMLYLTAMYGVVLTRSGKNSLRIPPSLQSSVPLVAGSGLTRCRLGRGPLGGGWSATICAPTSACLVAGHGSLRSGGIKIESLAKKSCPCLERTLRQAIRGLLSSKAPNTDEQHQACDVKLARALLFCQLQCDVLSCVIVHAFDRCPPGIAASVVTSRQTKRLKSCACIHDPWSRQRWSSMHNAGPSHAKSPFACHLTLT